MLVVRPSDSEASAIAPSTCVPTEATYPVSHTASERDLQEATRVNKTQLVSLQAAWETNGRTGRANRQHSKDTHAVKAATADAGDAVDIAKMNFALLQGRIGQAERETVGDMLSVDRVESWWHKSADGHTCYPQHVDQWVGCRDSVT